MDLSVINIDWTRTVIRRSPKMKYLLPALFLIACVAADVSHLNNEYLPPLGQHEHHHHHEHAEYAEQTNEVPQVIGANTYTPAHLIEPSNSLEPEASQQYTLRDEDIRIDQSSSHVETAEASQPAQQEVAFQPEPAAEPEPQHAEAAEATHQAAISFQFDAPAAVEQQPAAQEFVPQTVGDLIYSRVPEQGPAGLVEQNQYEAAASSSSSASAGIDTQYGSNGGYVY